MFGLLASGTRAATITLDIDPLGSSVSAGGTATFSGRITNRSGVALDATDLFLGFAGFDVDVLIPTQVLGAVPFTLLDFRFIDGIDLFRLDVDATAATGSYTLDVFLSDVQGNVSDTVSLSLDVVGNSGQPVPEPGTASVVALSLAALAACRRTNGRRRGAQVASQAA